MRAWPDARETGPPKMADRSHAAPSPLENLPKPFWNSFGYFFRRKVAVTSLLPFQTSDVVQWRDQLGVVVEVRGERVAVVTDDGIIRLTTQEVLRVHQLAQRGAA